MDPATVWRVFYRLSNGEVCRHGVKYPTEGAAKMAVSKLRWGGFAAWCAREE